MALFQNSPKNFEFCSVVLIGIAFVLFSAVPVFSTTFVVDRIDDDPASSSCTNASNDCSLRGAISKANLTAEQDEIILPSAFFYLTVSGANEDNNATGDLDVTSDMIFTGQGMVGTVINGSDLDRVFHVQNGAAAIFRNLAVMNGRTELKGAGIYQVGGSLTIENCMILGNDAWGVTSFGGGIHCTGALLISDSQIRENNAGDPGNMASGGTGGGVYVVGNSFTITRCIVAFNKARFGGGLHAREANGEISYSTFVNNAVYEEGGGGYLEDTTSSIMNSTFRDNDGGQMGGGLFVGDFLSSNSSTTILNSTFSNNIARGGGGLYVHSGTMDLSFVTVTENKADHSDIWLIGDGGGLYKNSSPTAVVRIKNSILGGNSDGSSGFGLPVHPDCSGDIISMGGNIFGNTSGCTGYTEEDDVNVDPNLSPLADNGGLTWTHSLAADSPAIDFCFECTDVGGSPVKFDQRDVERPYFKVYACDSGAYESEYGSVWGSSCPDCTGDTVVIENHTVVAGDTCNCTAAVSTILGPNFTVESRGSFTVNSPNITIKPEVRINQNAYFKTNQTAP